MARYIDCDKCYHAKVCAYKEVYKGMIVDCKKHIPTADVVEVVHCADCKHLVVYDNFCMYFGHKTNDNDFCSYGESSDT